MNSFVLKIPLFGLAGAITAAAWVGFWPRASPEPMTPAPPPPTDRPDSSWSSERVDSLMMALEKADSLEAKLNAAADLLQIPDADVRDAVEKAVAKNSKRLSLVAKMLLIRWAAEDGEAATLWAWKRLRSEGSWEAAFQEIGPSWAAHNPAGLAKWAMSAAEGRKPGDDPDMAEAETMETPHIGSGILGSISRWLVTEDPQLAYELIRKRGGMSSDDQKTAQALASVEKVREALTAFGDLTIKNPNQLSGDEIQLYYLLLRWHQLDSDDFNRSKHAGSISTDDADQSAAAVARWKELPAAERFDDATKQAAGIIPAARGWRIQCIASAWAETDPATAIRWLDSLPEEDRMAANTARVSAIAAHDLTATLDWVDGLPLEQRPPSLVPAFDAWTKAHPGERADRSGWPAERVIAWEDLEALQAPM